MTPEVSFKDFAELSRRRSWTAQFLAEQFKRRIEAPMEFFHRILSGRYPGTVIPYRPVIKFYLREIAVEGKRAGSGKTCACGCGLPVFDRKKWAFPGCRKKAARKQGTDWKKRGM